MRIKYLLFLCVLQSVVQGQVPTGTLTGQVSEKASGRTIPGATLYFPDLDRGTISDNDGRFTLPGIPYGEHRMQVSFIGYQRIDTMMIVEKPLHFWNCRLAISASVTAPVLITDTRYSGSAYSRLKSIEGTAIYASKKNEIIALKNITANLSSNNARQVFARVPGVTVWESDAAGLQLGVGARGLSPDRTSNFNTRQNGYDIAADALGYPESYYAPPMQAIDRIEIVRGAASLQYGTQFGGMINLKLKQGEEGKKWSGKTLNTYNSVGYFNTYNELGGQHKKLNYYAFWNFRIGSGFRDHTEFEAQTYYVRFGYQWSNRLKVSTDYTHMSYLAQQPGGLTDVQFAEDPYQSLRARNWFKVKWNLASLHLDYKLTDQATLNTRFFGLLGTRQAVGYLQTPNRPDIPPFVHRDLLVDHYGNIGNETRFLQKYRLGKQPSAFLAGIRWYKGSTEKVQGFGSQGSDADFTFIREDLRLKSDYDFPSRNLAFFTENVFNLSDKISITPGIRAERIVTTADGYFDSSIRIPLTGEVVIDSLTPETRNRERNLVLLGLGISYRIRDDLEWYTNFSQNYRAITFNAIRVVSPSAAVDPQLKDERGFNLDIGLRGQPYPWLTLDWGLFWLKYQDRIGSYLQVIEDEFFGQRLVRYTTNIADAHIAGVESYIEVDLNKLGQWQASWQWQVFTNVAYTYARYYNAEEAAIEDKRVEYVPEWNFKTGVQGQWHSLGITVQMAYVSAQFSEATNAGSNGSSTGIFGTIPSYLVFDCSADYSLKGFLLEAGINNLLNSVYFTRRATGYPGPGIIPATPRNLYLGLGYSF